ncbi:oligoribonuclease [Brachybacterium atlanticum]|uniref:oligoribonuclease n=1 Tax=Brachybacterium atlanticum TaxID=2911888 RepID=UPI0021E0BF06|nr:oligoribonuclease [Brachybacterium atlanticum]
MPAANPDLIVWIDTETTGLDPATDDLLEIAVVVTCNDLTELGAFNIVTTPADGAHAAIERMDAFVHEMHTANGLIDAIEGSEAHAPRTADALAAGAIDRFTAGHTGPFLLGGNSITHDRGFLARHAPQTFSRLHYRSIDVSGIEQEMLRDGYDQQITAWRDRFVPSDAHRALADIRDSIRQLDALRSIRRARALVA